MSKVIHRFNLDLHSSQSQISIPVQLQDSARAFHITLSEGGAPYFLEDGSLVTLTVQHPSGETNFVFECAILNNTTIVHDFAEIKDQDTDSYIYTAAVVGTNRCELTICNALGEIVGSPKFTMVVHSRVTPRSPNLPQSDKMYLDSILSNESIRQAKEEERHNAEKTREANESIRKTNEASRTAQWNERVKDIDEAKTLSTTADRNATEAITIAKEKVANALVASKTGSAITIDDVSPLQDSLSVKVRSKNLIPFPYKSDVFHGDGADLIVNADGTLKVQHHNTDVMDVYLECDITEPFTIEESGAYSFFDNYALGSVCETYLVVEGTNETLPSGTYELTKGTSVRLAFYLNASGADGWVLAPQLEKGAVATAYTSPVVLSVVNVVKTGKNLFDIRKVLATSVSDKLCYISNVGADYVEVTTPSNYSGVGYCNTGIKLGELCPELREGDVVTLSYIADTSIANNFFHLGDNGAWKNGASKTVTKAELNTEVAIYGSKDSGTVAKISNIQIEFGTSATAKEPYREPESYNVSAEGAVDGIMADYSFALTTDTPGTLIECNYKRDINKAYEELCNAIISLGGNV